MQGEGVAWSPDSQWVLYDCKHQDGYYNIHICRPDGTDDRCLTTLDNGLPHRHAGTPAWQPTGKYIALAAEKKVHPGGSVEAIPGFGGRSNIWVMLADGSKAWQLTDTGEGKDFGVLFPTFSPDGTKMSWTERVHAGSLLHPRMWLGDWVIKIADFVDSSSGPRLANIRTLQPGGPGFYEGYGFSPDGAKIIFCSDFERQNALNSQIYVMDAADGKNLTCLTDGTSYNEHASFSPDGRHIVWMTNQGNHGGGTDWWIMHADGSDKQRLTHFNQAGFPESSPSSAYSGLTKWASDGLTLLGGVQYSLVRQEGRIFRMTLDPSLLSK